jgi:hypothetical protein
VVVPQQPAKPLTATNGGAPEGAALGRDQLVAEPLMVPLPMVVRHELIEGAEQATLAEEDEVVQTDRSKPSAASGWAGCSTARAGSRRHALRRESPSRSSKRWT